MQQGGGRGLSQDSSSNNTGEDDVENDIERAVQADPADCVMTAHRQWASDPAQEPILSQGSHPQLLYSSDPQQYASALHRQFSDHRHRSQYLQQQQHSYTPSQELYSHQHYSHHPQHHEEHQQYAQFYHPQQHPTPLQDPHLGSADPLQQDQWSSHFIHAAATPYTLGQETEQPHHYQYRQYQQQQQHLEQQPQPQQQQQQHYPPLQQDQCQHCPLDNEYSQGAQGRRPRGRSLHDAHTAFGLPQQGQSQAGHEWPSTRHLQPTLAVPVQSSPSAASSAAPHSSVQSRAPPYPLPLYSSSLSSSSPTLPLPSAPASSRFSSQLSQPSHAGNRLLASHSLPTLLSFSGPPAPPATAAASYGQPFQHPSFHPEPISRRKRGRSSYSAVLGSSTRDSNDENSALLTTAGYYNPQFQASPFLPEPSPGAGQGHGTSSFSNQQASAEKLQHGYPVHLADDSGPSVPRRRDSLPRVDGSNKRPLVLSPNVEQALDSRSQREALERRGSRPLQHQEQQRQRFSPYDMQQPESASISGASTSTSSSKQVLPMPHFRTQLMHTSEDSSYQRRFYPSSSSPSSSKLPSSLPTLSSSSSPSPAPFVHKGTAARRQHSSSPVASPADASVAVSTQLGRLLISTKQHVSDVLESFIFPKDDRDVKQMTRNLEGVLVDLLNGMLQSHDAFATRDNLSSQEQPLDFRPTVIHSLAQFRDLLTHPRHPASSFASTATALAEASSPPIVAGQRQHPHLPTRFYATFPEVMEVESDTDTHHDARGGPGVPRDESYIHGKQNMDDSGFTEMYKSTVEFLALMTAFVSVVCWLMQTRLSDVDTPRPDLQSEAGRVQTRPAEMKDIDMGGLNDDRQKRGIIHDSSKLSAFLDFFSDRDNVLKPIKDAMTRATSRNATENIQNESGHLDQEVGLFAWHYLLFGSDQDGPLERDGSSIDADAMRSVHFDVILNELYTTHVLSMTVKEHQKDHGQFYTPPGIVDFMWKRSIREDENLLGTLMAVSNSIEEGRGSHRDYTMEHLIPSALDPCLGVSTFLSCYIRLLIQEAQKGSAVEAIWNSESGSRLLLYQICEHVWGIELDGFAFWMARCGILAALMPLVQRVQELSRCSDSAALQEKRAHLPSKLPRLHLFRSDTLQLAVPKGNTPEIEWERYCILKLRDPKRLQFDYIVTNPPYMIRKTGTFSTPDAEVFDWATLGSIIALDEAATVDDNSGTTGRLRSKQRTRELPLKPSRGVGDEVKAMDVTVDIGYEEAGNESDAEIGLSESGTSTPSTTSRSGRAFPPMRPGAKGMMQAYGYFIWFGAQRIKPHYGVLCMITASQWLTLEFAARIRAWLFNHCLMEEFFQFEPFKVFSKVQTDSLIFKIRALGSQHPDTAQAHRTVFLRHMDHHKPLTGILQDYSDFLAAGPPAPLQSELSLNIMMSSKTRAELQAAILRETALPPTIGSSASSSSTSNALPLTYSFAPMMPSSELTTHLLALTQDLGGICSAGTKRINRLSAAEPLLWHRGPNTNPVYGLVVRMEYARSEFGEAMAQRWFRPAFYWNGKNSPEGANAAAAIASGSKVMHKEGAFWQGRDRLRLSKKEGSPAESYLVSVPDVQRMYGLCMVDKEAVKVLRRQVEEGVDGSHALWTYLTNVRNHFQPGLAVKKKKTAGRQPSVDDDGVAFCSTNQCGFDVPEKIIHPINYGYFSKTQPRQRFFLDTSSLAVTNQCIYLTLNRMSHHYNEQQSPPLLYFLTLLNSSTLQFFVLHHCQYDQQGRMRLFRDSMAKIPFQDRDVKHHPERTRYAARLGELMISLKETLYRLVSAWQLTGSQHGFGRPATAESIDGSGLNQPAANSGSFGGNQGLLDWVRRGGDAPAGMLMRTRQQVHRMLLSVSAHTQPASGPTFLPHADTDMDSVMMPDIGRGTLIGTPESSSSMGSSGQDPQRPALISLTAEDRMARECDTIMQAIERAIEMIEGLQWAVDQYGYMLYGILPKFQKLLEMELKVVYSSKLESWIVPTSPLAPSSSAAFASHQDPSLNSKVAINTALGQSPADSMGPGDTFIGLQRWDGDTGAVSTENNTPGSTGSVPEYAPPLLARAQSSIQTLRSLLQAYPSFSQ